MGWIWSVQGLNGSTEGDGSRRRWVAAFAKKCCAFVVVVLIACFANGCAYNNLSETTCRREGGCTQRIFSRFFQNSTVLVEEKIGLDLVLDIQKREIPVLYEFARFLGVLGPWDLTGHATVTGYLFNFSQEDQKLTLESVDHYGEQSLAAPIEVLLKPRALHCVSLGRVEVNRYGRGIPLTLQFDYGGERKALKIVANRLTYETLQRQARDPDAYRYYVWESGYVPPPEWADQDSYDYAMRISNAMIGGGWSDRKC